MYVYTLINLINVSVRVVYYLGFFCGARVCDQEMDIYIDKRNDYLKGIARYNMHLIHNCQSFIILIYGFRFSIKRNIYQIGFKNQTIFVQFMMISKKEKWIQLIVKTVKKVLCPQLILNHMHDHNIQGKNEIYPHYPFENYQLFPICVTLCDRITIKLFKPHCITKFYDNHVDLPPGNEAMTTTLCLMIRAK